MAKMLMFMFIYACLCSNVCRVDIIAPFVSKPNYYYIYLINDLTKFEVTMAVAEMRFAISQNLTFENFDHHTALPVQFLILYVISNSIICFSVTNVEWHFVFLLRILNGI